MTTQQPMLPGMPADDPSPEPATRLSETVPQRPGFSSAEQFLGAAAAYRAPIASSVAATEMLRTETDPVRRGQLVAFRSGALIWWGVGALVAALVVIVAISVASSHRASGSCKGGRDSLDILDITYQSGDGIHWTGTYPCIDGGSTTVPVPARDVPGGGQ